MHSKRYQLNNAHKDQTGYILCSGPSLPVKNEELKEFLSCQLLIGTNLAYKYIEPTYLVVRDKFIWQHFYGEISQLQKTTVFTWEYTIPDNKKIPDNTITLLRKAQTFLLPDGLHNTVPIYNNAGLSALGICYALGLKNIYILGADLGQQDGKNNWHFDYTLIDPYKSTPSAFYDECFEVFKNVIREMQKRDISIINCSPVSRLRDIIPYMEYEELYNKEIQNAFSERIG